MKTHKLILTVAMLAAAFTASAQHAGYSQLTDLSAFKAQFTATAQKTTSIKSDFVQEKNLSMLSEKITSKGKFWFKKDNMVRMEYMQPSKYLMIINKDNILVKDEQKENKINTKSNKLFQQINKIIIDCVQGSILSNPDFKVKVFENKGSYLVELAPLSKGIKDFFKSINISVDKKDNSVSNIDMQEPSGDNTTIHFINKEINANLPDALFAAK
ncbi:outer membrane lipoprotein carrier protein LolA [Mucilaginibacter sp. KACC 22773]|uniref:LolA family protein n=1 Tax=Mucilaginibacter sp. KACC 22773 TaxID=3025671 RepID=UPI0023657290|nr:outer membrane lipoprotein carrier protein LolA [Mucilaginibacter sp. KACC 22773]WDF77943.1 outer membrane lipoprotein carrier protein LolA [Mucilaginibacter sp. KACC 22773]